MLHGLNLLAGVFVTGGAILSIPPVHCAARGGYSLTPADLMTCAQRAMSRCRNAVNSCGVLATISEPSLVSLSRTSGARSDLTIAALSAATIAVGVRAGAATPNQLSTSKPLKP